MVETWHDVLDVALPFVSFQTTTAFRADDSVLTSTSTLRFRTHAEVTRSLERASLSLRETPEAPDRLGKENVFLAERR